MVLNVIFPADDAKIKTLLIPTNEELMIVRDIERLKKNN
jgi:acetate kinase